MCKKRGENSLALTPFHEFILVYCGVVDLVGGLPFWEFSVAMIWRGRVGSDFS